MAMQGIRRVVAVTGAEAEAAMSKAEGLTVAVDNALTMSGPQLEATATALRLVRRLAMPACEPPCWLDTCTLVFGTQLELTQGGHAQDVEGSALPAAAKAALRTKLATLQKRVLEEMKAAAAANKARASSAALEAAGKALVAGHKFAVMQLEVPRHHAAGLAFIVKTTVMRMVLARQPSDKHCCRCWLMLLRCVWQVGLDSKAVMDAWQAIHKQHPTLPVMMITADASESSADYLRLPCMPCTCRPTHWGCAWRC